MVPTHFSQGYPSTKPLVENTQAVFPRVRGVRDVDRPLPRSS